MFLVEFVVALILPSILPHIISSPVHNPVLELAMEVTTIGPLEATKSAHLVGSPLASILGPISPKVDPISLLDSVLEVSVVIATVAPDLNSLAILLILGSDFGL